MNISILLPYKENYSPTYPGAVSLFVDATSKLSIYRKDITVFGNTEYIKKLYGNYINIKLPKNNFYQVLYLCNYYSIFFYNLYCHKWLYYY